MGSRATILVYRSTEVAGKNPVIRILSRNGAEFFSKSSKMIEEAIAKELQESLTKAGLDYALLDGVTRLFHKLMRNR